MYTKAPHHCAFTPASVMLIQNGKCHREAKVLLRWCGRAILSETEISTQMEKYAGHKKPLKGSECIKLINKTYILKIK